MGKSTVSSLATLFLLLASLSLLPFFTQCKQEPTAPKPEKIQRDLPKMNTLVKITVFEGDREKANQALDAAFEEIDRVEKVMSVYIEDSEVSRLNREAFKKPFPLSEEVFNLIEKSIKISEETKGAFDITVAPLVEIWKGVKEKGALPEQEAIDKALEITGYKKLVLDKKARTLRFEKEGMSIDLGGIAKGYAIASAINVLKEKGIQSALVDAGGDIYAMGEVGKRPGWDVGVHKPVKRQDPANPKIHCTLRLKDVGVVTSGTYERFVEIDGKRYAHIIDPRTGLALSGELVQVTLIGPDVVAADAYCTALMVMGQEEGLPFVEKLPGYEVFFFRLKRGRRLFSKHTAGITNYTVRKSGPLFE